MAVKTLLNVQVLSNLERYLIFLSIFYPEFNEANALCRLMKSRVKGGTVSQVAKLCERLVDAGFMSRAPQRRDLFWLSCSLDVSAVRNLLDSADKGNWWPSCEDIKSGLSPFSFSAPSNRSINRTIAVADLLRMFCRAEYARPDKALTQMLAGSHGHEVLQAAAWIADRIFHDEPTVRVDFVGTPMESFLPLWLNLAFAHGRSLDQTMDAIRQALTEAAAISRELVEIYAAVAVWMGRADDVAAIPRPGQTPAVKALVAAARGDFEAAAKGAAAYCDAGVSYEGFAVRTLLAMACAAAKPEKPPKTRVTKLLRGCTADTYNCHPACVSYYDAIHRLSMILASAWTDALGGGGNVIGSWFGKSRPTPGEALMMAWDYRFISVGRAKLSQQADLLAQEARRLAAAGYLTLADMIFTLLHGGFDPKAFAPVLDTLKGKAIPFFAQTEAEPEWKGILAALEKVIDKPKSPATKGRRLVWHVEMDGTKDDASVIEVYPAIRCEGDPEDGRHDAVFDSYNFRPEKWKDIMTDADRLLWKTLEADDYYFSDEGIARTMVGLPNLYRVAGSSRRSRDAGETVSPMKIRRGSLTLETTLREDGGRVLSLPSWMKGFTSAESVLRQVAPGVYEFCEFTRQQRKLLETFHLYSTNGKLTLPPESLPQAEKILKKVDAVAPLAEKVTDSSAELPRVPAETSLVVRLAFDEGILRIHPVIQPVKDNPNMTFDPGLGAAEKLVVGAARSYVLVRDIAAELTAAEPARSALESVENWFDGQSRWTIDDLPAALGALVALKSVQPPLRLEWLEGKKLSVTQAPKSGITLRSRRTAEDSFRVEGDFQLDDGRVLGLMELVEAMAHREGNYVRLSDGDYVALTQTLQRQIAALKSAGRRKGEGLEVVKAAVPMLDGVFGEGEGSLELPQAMVATAEEIRAAFAKRPQPPNTLNAELRPYQREGYRWLSRLASCAFGSCLADDMGLGKTVQIISVLLERAADGPSLVFAPSSVCGNWRRELQRFAPTLNPLLPQEDLACLEKAGPRDVVIASYGFLLFHEDDFAGRGWNGVVLDEAQAIKNDASKRAKAVKRLSARFRIAATGTPVENRLGELWSLFDFLNPGLLGPAASFAQRFTDDGMAVPELKRLVKPLILRRLKGEVLDDLPEKTEITLPIELGTTERTAYEACRRRALAALESGEAGEPNRMSILAELTRLRRFCCHPSLVLGTNEVPSAKLEALAGLLSELRLAGHRALVFSQFTDYLAIVRKLMTTRGWTHAYLDGSTPTLEREKLVNAFQSGEGDFFVISLKAGGTGLNLTAADYVILLDPWWNPAVENQAADRAHRIGQTRPVTVYRLIASDTVEERVLALHKEKQAIAEDILDGTSSSALSPAQLMALFQ